MGCLGYILTLALQLAWLAIQFAFYALVILYTTICILIPLMEKPIAKLFNLTTSPVQKRLIPTARLNAKFSAFNGFYPFLLFVSAIVFCGVVITVQVINWDPSNNFFATLLFNTPMLSMVSLFQEGLDFTPGAIVAIAFAGYLFRLCMEAHNSTTTVLGKEETVYPKLYIRIPCYIVYLVASCILASLLGGVFQSVGTWGLGAIRSLWTNTNRAFFPMVGKILLLIPLVYVAFFLLLVVVREYAETIVFGLVSFLILMFAGLVIVLLTKNFPVLQSILSAILGFGLIIGADVVRNIFVDKFDDKIKDWMRDFRPLKKMGKKTDDATPATEEKPYSINDYGKF